VPITACNPFKWRHYPGDVIMWCVRWYLRYPISVADMAEMTEERGCTSARVASGDGSKSTDRSWTNDARGISNRQVRVGVWMKHTSKVKGQDRFLYRAIDSSGQTIDFLLTAKRDAEAAKRFFRRVFSNCGNSLPRVINVDKNRAYPTAVDGLKEEGTMRRRCRLRQCKYLNNIVEQDHRNVKRRTWLAKGYGSVTTAWRTLRGIEAMDMIRRGRVRRVAKGDTVGRLRFIGETV
jgi:IS6 family transposase